MRVFVAGGTGTLGRPTVRMLVAAGHEVRALARTAERGAVLRALGAEPVVADVFDLLTRSQRVDNTMFKAVTRWTPRHPSVRQGWRAVADALKAAKSA